MPTTPKVSLIISTYNWPKALNLVLESVKSQSTQPFEVLIADDGSKQETAMLIKQWQKTSTAPLIHIWQEDKGFQLAKIRNKAAIQAKGDYLVFIDGDCLLRENFVKNHINLASPGYFVAGNRVLIKEEFTKELIREQKQIHQLRPWQYSSTQLKRRWPLLELPLGPIRKLRRNSWKPLKGCNFALWKKDFFAINGVDEAFVGWGYEDSEMTVRLLHNGLKLLSGRFSTTVLHIWHPEQDRSNENENWKKLHEVINSNKKVACLGISEQITNNKKESFTYRVE